MFLRVIGFRAKFSYMLGKSLFSINGPAKYREKTFTVIVTKWLIMGQVAFMYFKAVMT